LLQLDLIISSPNPSHEPLLWLSKRSSLSGTIPIKTLLRQEFGLQMTLVRFWVAPLYTSYKAGFIEIVTTWALPYLFPLVNSPVVKWYFLSSTSNYST
jgi:hypothetical protein